MLLVRARRGKIKSGQPGGEGRTPITRCNKYSRVFPRTTCPQVAASSTGLSSGKSLKLYIRSVTSSMLVRSYVDRATSRRRSIGMKISRIRARCRVIFISPASGRRVVVERNGTRCTTDRLRCFPRRGKTRATPPLRDHGFSTKLCRAASRSSRLADRCTLLLRERRRIWISSNGT